MLQKKLTTKQQQILTHISHFRFLDSYHIQQFLQHKDKRRINTWLLDLTKKQYIIRRYNNQIIGKNKISAIYSLNNQGVRYIKTLDLYDQNGLHKLYWDKKRSESFISHCLFIATICTALEQNKINTTSYETVMNLSSPQNSFHFLTTRGITVDLVIRNKSNETAKKNYLLTYFEDSLPRYRVRKRIRMFREFYFNNEWEDTFVLPFPTLLFVFQSKERMIYTKRYTKSIFERNEGEDLSINFATVDDIKKHGIFAGIWEEVTL